MSANTELAELPESGAELPSLEIPVTAKLIVSGALASRDFQDVHHDKAAAQALGSPDIFMNILTTNGLVGRFVTDWAGPGARLKRINIKLGAPNYPGDAMVLKGEVTRVDDAERIATVSVSGQNSLGPHVTGEVLVQWPAEDAQ